MAAILADKSGEIGGALVVGISVIIIGKTILSSHLNNNYMSLSIINTIISNLKNKVENLQ